MSIVYIQYVYVYYMFMYTYFCIYKFDTEFDYNTEMASAFYC